MPRDSVTTDPERRRGVQASPARLRKALADSGLRTQAALADRIAELEQIEVPPRGLVNRIFKGDAVDPGSIERVARALGVPGWTLYRTRDEPDVTAAGPAVASEEHADASAPPATRPALADDQRSQVTVPPAAATHVAAPRRIRFAVAALALAVVGSGLWLTGRRQDAGGSGSAPPTAVARVMLEVEGPRGTDLESALNRVLPREWRVVPRPESLVAVDAQALIAAHDIDRVVTIRSSEVGRRVGIVLYVHERGLMREAWAGAVRSSAPAAELAHALRPAVNALVHPEASRPARAATRESLERYLSGRRELDGAHVELALRRAMTDFATAARLSPGFVEAYAGLCEALVADHVRTGDATRLTEADTECSRALALDGANREARRAQAYLLRRKGRLDEARGAFESVLREAPDNVDALLGLAEVQITRHARGEGDDALARARELLTQARSLEPRFWKVPYVLARAEYAGADLPAAIAASRDSVALDANVLALSNLGSFQFCAGDLRAARDAYERARTQDSQAFVGDGQLGVVAYFLRDYAAAVGHLRRAVELHEASGKAGDHRLWSNLADALRRHGEIRPAVDAYAKAIVLAERDRSEGDGSPAHTAYLAYYYEVLSSLDGERWRARRATAAELQELAKVNDPFSLMYVATIFYQRGDAASAQAIQRRGAAGCPGFLKSPDLMLRPWGADNNRESASRGSRTVGSHSSWH